MPHRGKHQAAGNGIPRPNPKFFETITGPMTWERWQHLRAHNHRFTQIENAVFELYRRFPPGPGSHTQDTLLESEEMTRLIELVESLPAQVKPRLRPQPLTLARFSLALSGRLMEVRQTGR